MKAKNTPKPIRVKSPASLKISLVPDPLPYLYVESGLYTDVYGYIEDRDVKRLLKWCERCLSSRKASKKRPAKASS